MAAAAAASPDFDVSDAIRIVGGGIEVSRNDDRDYAYARLPNGMRIVVVSDPSVEQAAAAAVVQVGSFEDSKDLAGSAHALEHMCFMGSDRFPDENDWSSWLSANGGQSNAYTASTVTNYHYALKASSLRASLERWSRFFVAPLLHEAAWERELHNIDSEHAKNINNDMWREMQLDRSTASPDHAMRHFATGNKETLHDTPEAAGIDVRARLLDFHKRHYTASRMTIALLGQEPAETLLAWARELFADVRDDGEPLPSYGPDPYAGVTAVVQRMVPLRERRSVTVGWTIPPQRAVAESGPASIASHLLGHEGPGSLLAELKARGFASGLSAGQYAAEDDFSTFVVQVELTPEGLARADDVIAGVFAYTRMLRREGAEAQRWVFDEVAAVQASGFRFRGKGSPMGYVTTLANQLCHFEEARVVSGSSLLRRWDPEAYGAVLAALTPGAARVRVVAQDEGTKAACTSKEPVYGTDFAEEPMTDAQLALWGGRDGDADVPAVAELYPGMALPRPNPFVATDFALRSGLRPGKEVDAEARAAAGPGGVPRPDDETEGDAVRTSAARGVPVCGRRLTPTPAALEDSPSVLALWHQDAWFGEPKVTVRCEYHLPRAYADVGDSVLLNLLAETLTDDLTEMAYDAEVAGLAYRIGASTRGLTLHVSGFSHRASALLDRVTAAVAAAAAGDPASLTVAAVRRRSVSHAERLANTDMAQPYELAIYEATHLTRDPSHHYHDKRASMAAWAAEHAGDADAAAAALRDRLSAFAVRAFSRGGLRALVHGNADEAEARSLVGLLRRPLASSPPPDAADPLLPGMSPRAAVPGPGTDSRVVLPPRNPSDPNGAIQLMLFLGPDSLTTSTVASLLSSLMAEPAFDQLRTKEALGYIVFAGYFRLTGAAGVRVIVQSQLLGARGLEERAEAFLWAFRRRLAAMTEDDFRGYADAFVAKLHEGSSAQSSEASRLWTEVSEGTMCFRRAQEQIRVARSTSLADVVALFDGFVAPGAPHRRRVCVVMTEGEAPSDGAEAAEAAPTPKAGDLPTAPETTTLAGAEAADALLACLSTPVGRLADSAPRPALAAPAADDVPPPLRVLELPGATLKAAWGRLPSAEQAGIAAWRLRTAEPSA